MVKKLGYRTMDVMPHYAPCWWAMDDDYCHNLEVDVSGTKTDAVCVVRDNDAGSDRAPVEEPLADYGDAPNSLRDVQVVVVVVGSSHLGGFRGSAVAVETGCVRDAHVVVTAVFAKEVVVVVPEHHTVLLQIARGDMGVADDPDDAAAVVGKNVVG